jgi:elongation factor P
MMIAVTDLKKGMAIELDGLLYTVLDFQHIKMGRGSAQVRLRLRDVRAGHTIERTFQAGEKFQRVDLDLRPAQYLYRDGDLLYFMDTVGFDQMPLASQQLGDGLKYLKEGMTVTITLHGDVPVGVEMPITADLRVIETGPSFKGDTASSGTKPAVLETGITVHVPFFINVGDVVRVDTRDGHYVERA